ncbi:MAG: GTPase Der [Myxococcota bacterium]|nr:GTPase Der [Myxococcota bacterium]
MIPCIAIVGRPNCGKSTLFNRLIGRRKAIVEDMPGVTRDRNEGVARWKDGRMFRLVDTGGYEPGARDFLPAEVHRQVESAVKQAHVVIFLLDGQSEPLPLDASMARILRRAHKHVYCVANKVDGESHELDAMAFHRLGFDEVHTISALHGRGVDDLINLILDNLEKSGQASAPGEDAGEAEQGAPRIAVVGKPNAGKSTLVNQLAGASRMIVSDIPGTTRDAVEIPFSSGGREYILVDTAGIRRKRSIKESVEVFSVQRAFQAIEYADAAILMFDATQGLTDQDEHIAGRIHEAGKAAVVFANKWDAMPEGVNEKHFIADTKRKLKFLDYAPVLRGSAQQKKGLRTLMKEMGRVLENRSRVIQTSELNKVIELIQQQHPPSFYKDRRVKLYFAAQVGVNPPVFQIKTNYPKGVHFSYERYVINAIRKQFGLDGTPIKVVFKPKNAPRYQADNPERTAIG